MSIERDNLLPVRTYLQGQTQDYLVDLLIDLVQAIDEPLRQRFWERLAPPQMATADMLYESPDAFLEALAAFETEVADGVYFDEDALEYYGQDPLDRDYYEDKYGDVYGFEPGTHTGLNKLEQFLTEAHSYYQAKQYEVAASAYSILMGVMMNASEETLGVYDPMGELGEDEEVLVRRYFKAVKESYSLRMFFERGIAYLARVNTTSSYYDQKHEANFMALVGTDNRDALKMFLEKWAEVQAQREGSAWAMGMPYQVRLLTRLYEAENQQGKIQTLQRQLRHVYMALYEPLLAASEASKDWQTVVAYGQEVLAALPSEDVRGLRMQAIYWPRPAIHAGEVRKQMAHAYEALGKVEMALEVYRPVFDQNRDFERYGVVKRLLNKIDITQSEQLTTELVKALREELPDSLYFLCQLYLNEGQFVEAYKLVNTPSRYGALEATKLVAKAHLLMALGPLSADMGRYLKDLYNKVEVAEKEATQFLHNYLPAEVPNRKATIARAETLYRSLMQMHIDNGRKTYAVAAYYCALLKDIALYEGRGGEFWQFYQELLGRYPRHRALRREMEEKVKRS